MFRFHSVVRQAMLALALVCASAAASAGPSYHVTVNTAGLSGSGFLDFRVEGGPSAVGAVATVTNLFGSFGAEAGRGGAVVGTIPAGFTLSNAVGENYLTQALDFGGLFGFDISFAGDYETVSGVDGATFAIGLLDGLFAEYTLAATFAAQPPGALGGASLSAEAQSPAVAIDQVSEVPEPSELALMLTALVAAGAMLRRRR